jgi:signal recognition particle receptor subunit alpha
MALEAFSIFALSGLVLWEKNYENVQGILSGDPIGDLISNVLLQERGGSGGHHEVGAHQIQYSVSTTYGLVFLAVYNKGISIPWVSKLVNKCKKVFTKKYDLDFCMNYDGGKVEFGKEFTFLITEAIESASRGGGSNSSNGSIAKVGSPTRGMRSFGQTAKGKKIQVDNEESDKKKKKKKKKKKNKNNVEEELSENDEESGEGEEAATGSDSKVENETKTLFRGMSVREKRSGPRGFNQRKKNTTNVTVNGASSTSQKKTHWKDATSIKLTNKQTQQLMDSLNANSNDQSDESQLEEFRRKYLGDDDDGWGETKKNNENGGWFSSSKLGKAMHGLANRITGNAVITEETLIDVKKAMISQLVKKNVARDVADVILDSVSQSVMGQSLSTFEKVSTVVNTSLEESLGRILTPKQELDLVRNVQESKKKGKPYVIVFVGINGVGKSTSLAKVCYHLLQKSFRPLIAACDTFRSGAVEQLKVHAECLGVDVYEQGYASDSSKVAQSAISFATREGHDVVLVDTAGRMQNNKPHMVALSAVITLNQPNLILFVGEALAGNDAIDQMTQFNQALRDHARTKQPRLIDGIVLTKFDCVDDKVGAAVSMVHKTATPIMFVGTGQKYTHLRKLNVEDVLRKLFA